MILLNALMWNKIDITGLLSIYTSKEIQQFTRCSKKFAGSAK